MDSIIVEIRSAEGGLDSKLLVEDQFNIYSRLATKENLEIYLTERTDGFICFKVSGKNVYKWFANEAGGHRWQRVPPTEKRGRVQTSTITVAILRENKDVNINIKESDLDWKFSRGTGPGGQHKNKTDTAVQLTHKPTGIIARCDGRSQSTNKEVALMILAARLRKRAVSQKHNITNDIRKKQVGSGMRGDKIRTIRVRDNKVVDHKTGKKTTYTKYAKGDFSDLVDKKITLNQGG